MRSPSERFWPVAAVRDRQLSVVVADPNYVQTLKLPEKGKMMSHRGCGFGQRATHPRLRRLPRYSLKNVGQTKAIIDAKKKLPPGGLELATAAERSSGIRGRLHLK